MRLIKQHWLDLWHVNPSLNRDYDFIDGLRGLAILMVVIGHVVYITPRAGVYGRVVGSLLATGGNGVTLFFALSGFLISWPFWKYKVTGANRTVPKGYGWRRFWKIYPPLALSILVLTPYYLLNGAGGTVLTVAGEWLSGLAFIRPVSGAFNPVMWSLVVEVQFYITVPLVFIFLKRLSITTCFWFLSLIFLVVPVTFRWCTGQTPSFFPEINSHFPSGLDSFYLGVMVAGLSNLGVLRAKNFGAVLGDVGLVLLIFAVVVCSWFHRSSEPLGFWTNEGIQWLFKLSGGFLLCYVADPQNPRARMLCAPWLRWCGIISYEWYLFHQQFICWIRANFSASGSMTKYILMVGSAFLASLALSALVYLWFSLPILKRGRAHSS